MRNFAITKESAGENVSRTLEEHVDVCIEEAHTFCFVHGIDESFVLSEAHNLIRTHWLVRGKKYELK